jgi:hypothetical protein
MPEESDLVTVYRSMDASAKDDCETIVGMLSAEGISALVWDDSFPSVPQGTFEVRVPVPQSAKAEQLVAENPLADEVEEVDNSAGLNLETIFQANNNNAEFQAAAIKNLLESNDIAAVLVGDSRIPTLPFEVRVAHDHAVRARLLIAEAETAGPAEAEKAELESEEPQAGIQPPV